VNASGKHARPVLQLLRNSPNGVTKQEACESLGITEKAFDLAVAFIREYNILEDDLRFVTGSWRDGYRYQLVETSMEVEEYLDRRYDSMSTALRRVANQAAVNARNEPNNAELQLFSIQAKRLHEDVQRLRRAEDGKRNGNGNGGPRPASVS